jgi:hypothetical protein
MLSERFTDSYSMRAGEIKRRIYQGEVPVLIRLGDDAIMLRGRQRSSVRILSERYHALKAVCHAPIALYLELRDGFDRPLADEALSRLGAVREALRAFSAEEQPMREVLDATAAFAERVRGTRRADEDELAAFEQRIRAPMRSCIELAAEDELTTLHERVMGFTGSFSNADWEAFRVVICASHQPRYRQSSKQYFKRLLQEHGGIEGQVLYGENCRTEQEAMELLTTHLLDRDLAAFFLDSPLDLQQDVLGDAAQRVVSRLFA